MLEISAEKYARNKVYTMEIGKRKLFSVRAHDVQDG